MRRNISILIPIVILIALALLLYYKMRPTDRYMVKNVTNFEECAEAGNPILESYPRQCKTKDGKSFTEDINQVTVNTFEDCVKAGFPILLSYPRVCDSETASFIEKPLTRSGQDLIRLMSPHLGGIVPSPLTIGGEARGNWFFEASFPVEILDSNGKQIAIAPAQAQGDWMTENFVPFRATLVFKTVPTTATGTLVLHKDNPSGLPEHDDELVMPIRFK